MSDKAKKAATTALSYVTACQEGAVAAAEWCKELERCGGSCSPRVAALPAALRALAALVEQCEQLSAREPSYVAPLLHEIAAGFTLPDDAPSPPGGARE